MKYIMKFPKSGVRFVVISIVFGQIFCSGLLYGADFWGTTSGPNTATVNTILCTGDPNVYAGTEGNGVFKRSVFPFFGWIMVNTNLGNLYVNDLSIFHSYLIPVNTDQTIIASTSGGVYTGNGGSWTLNADMAGKNVRVTLSKSYMTLPFGGVTWLWSGTDDGIFRSTNGGSSWAKAGLSGSSIIDMIHTSNYLYASTSGLHVYRSDDRADSWEEMNTGVFSGSYISDMAANADGDIFITTGHILATMSGGVYRSTDNGDTWETCLGSIWGGFVKNSVSYISIAINSEGFVFAGTSGGTVYVSMDNGETWERKSTGLGEGSVNALAFDTDGYAYAGTGNMIYRSLVKTTELPEVVSKPGTPDGDDNVYTDESHTYTTSGATSNMGHTIEYQFDWGDENHSAWSTSTSASHSWSSANTYTVTVTARCQTHTDIMSVSDGLAVNVAVRPKVVTPEFNPAAGSFLSAQSVEITCATSGATIYYTTDGSDPTELSAEYTVSVAISSTTTLKARAYKSGWTASDVASGTYEITGTVGTPSFDPVPGIYSTPQTVAIICATPGAAIHFTTDGSDPDDSDPAISSGGTVYISTTTTLKARAYKSGWTASDIASGTYEITGTVDTPSFDPVPGIYSTPRTVAIICATPGAAIHFTTDGSDPDDSDPAISSGGTVYMSSTTTLKARAYKSGWTASDIASGTYIINQEENAVENSETLPLQFELAQNFPNPFNPVTVITFALPEDTKVTLQVFNILGEKIAMLVDDEFYRAGTYTAMWGGRDQTGRVVNNGVYFYKLTAGNFRCIKKMSFMK